VTINGVRGTLVLDTGATFVSLKNSFAHKAGVEIDQESTVHLRTANGIVDGKRGRAQTIQLRSLLAKDVPIVVQAGEYGAGIDGLLGMSFLSRFSINIDAKTQDFAAYGPMNCETSSRQGAGHSSARTTSRLRRCSSS
jgi:aspartyl protease family protein